MSEQLARQSTESLGFSKDKLDHIKRHYAPDASDVEFEHFVQVCKTRALIQKQGRSTL